MTSPSSPAAPDGSLVAGKPLPAALAGNADPAVAAWREDLAERVERLLAAWELRVGAPFSPGGAASWVAPVLGAGGSPAVLKVAFAHEESRDEALGMAAWQGRGAARVLRHAVPEGEHGGGTTVLLLEHVRPGTELAEALPPLRRDEVIAELLLGLWITPEQAAAAPSSASPAEIATLRPLAGMCAWWADGAAAAWERHRAERAAGADLLPSGLVEHGLGLFRTLPADGTQEPMLLATDLHHHNVLARGGGADRRWVLIDPKPYVGDPHYDVLQHLLNHPERLREDPSAAADRMARLTGLDPVRTRRWLLARCVQEGAGMPAAAAAARRLAADGVA